MKTLRDNRIAERSKQNAAVTGTAQAVSADALVSRRALCGSAVKLLCALSLAYGSGSVARGDQRERSYRNHNEESCCENAFSRGTAWEKESD